MRSARTLILLVAGAALAFSGCLSDDGATTDSVDGTNPDKSGMSAEGNTTAMESIFVREGTSFRVATVCFTEGGGDFPADAAGLPYTFEADLAGTAVVWQDANGANSGTSADAEGTVPAGTANFYVCTDLTQQTPAFTATYRFELFQPLSTEAVAMEAEPEE